MNNDNIITCEDLNKEIEKRQKQIKREERLNKVKTKIKKGLVWVQNHPVETLILVSTTIKVGAKVVKTIEEYDHRYCKQYDPSADVYIELRRPMTGKESNQFALRRANGEKVSDILLDMKLMKR